MPVGNTTNDGQKHLTVKTTPTMNIKQKGVITKRKHMITNEQKPICKNCKHWQPFTELKGGTCESGKMEDTSGKDDETPPTDGISFSDYEGCKASLFTGPNFGCIHFVSNL